MQYLQLNFLHHHPVLSIIHHLHYLYLLLQHLYNLHLHLLLTLLRHFLSQHIHLLLLQHYIYPPPPPPPPPLSPYLTTTKLLPESVIFLINLIDGYFNPIYLVRGQNFAREKSGYRPSPPFGGRRWIQGRRGGALRFCPNTTLGTIK